MKAYIMKGMLLGDEEAAVKVMSFFSELCQD